MQKGHVDLRPSLYLENGAETGSGTNHQGLLIQHDGRADEWPIATDFDGVAVPHPDDRLGQGGKR